MIVVFLLTERSGSTLIGRLLSGCPMFHHGMTATYHAVEDAYGPNGHMFVATKPKHICPFFTLGTIHPKSVTSVLEDGVCSSFPFEVYADNIIDWPTPLIDTSVSPAKSWNSGVAWTVEHIEYLYTENIERLG